MNTLIMLSLVIFLMSYIWIIWFYYTLIECKAAFLRDVLQKESYVILFICYMNCLWSTQCPAVSCYTKCDVLLSVH